MGALGCVGMRLPDGTIVCCLAAKKSVQARSQLGGGTRCHNCGSA